MHPNSELLFRKYALPVFKDIVGNDTIVWDTINPISWPYHAVPFDYWRIYQDGMKALYEEAGLNVCSGIYETLEKVPSRRSFPGSSYQTEDRFRPRLKSWIQKLIGWPLSCSVDTITIGTKEVV